MLLIFCSFIIGVILKFKMKRSQMNKNVNRSKNTLYNCFNRNIVYPTILFNPVMLNKEESSPGVEIIEIKSDEEHNAQESNLNTQDTSCKSNDFKDDFLINGSARERGHLSQEQKNVSKRNIISETAFSQACTDFYGIDCHDRGDKIPSMFPLGNNSTSTETFSDDVDVFQFDDTLNDVCWNSDDSYNSHIAYIYNKKSLKPRQYQFKSNDPNNIPSLETSCSSFTDDDEPRKDFISIRTIATPIPTYIPRLNLLSSPTLPTVTEVTELNKSSLNITESNRSDTRYTKPVNTWFLIDKNNETTPNITVNYKHKLSTLSQREKRRMKLKEIQDQIVLDLKDDTAHCDSKINLESETYNPELQENSEDINKVEKIVNETETDIDNGNSLQKSEIKSPMLLQTKNHVNDVIVKVEGNGIGNGNNNIGKETIEVLNCDLDTSNVEKGHSNIEEISILNNNLSETNMSLLKPSEWTQYSADANSVPSLQLSFGTDYENEEISWFKRIFKYVRCCK